MRRIPYADYRVNEVIPVIDAMDFTNPSLERHQENRLFRKRYGIKIEFHQSGVLGKFNPLTPTCNTCLPKSQNFGETGKVNTMRSKV